MLLVDSVGCLQAAMYELPNSREFFSMLVNKTAKYKVLNKIFVVVNS